MVWLKEKHHQRYIVVRSRTQRINVYEPTGCITCEYYADSADTASFSIFKSPSSQQCFCVYKICTILKSSDLADGFTFWLVLRMVNFGLNSFSFEWVGSLCVGSNFWILIFDVRLWVNCLVNFCRWKLYD